jgi:hypothetical protein
MSGPTRQEIDSFVIPPGEDLVQYSPSDLAQKVQNLELTPEGTLKSLVGPCAFAKGPQSYLFSNHLPFSVFHASLLNGSAPTIYARTGSEVFRYEGWHGTDETYPFYAGGQWRSQLSGLSSNPSPRFPDQWIVLNDRIVWSNGVDKPRVFTYDGMVTPLGFDTRPTAPLALGPIQAGYQKSANSYPNTKGYSWQGDIGTSIESLTGEAGSVRGGTWYYYLQYEDIHGNLSEFSVSSNPVQTSTANADPFDPGGDSKETGVEIANLLRQFHVSLGSEAPDHCVAVRLYRTADTKNVGGEPQLLARLPGTGAAEYADNTPDSGLGSIWEETVSVPVFKLMCTHQGRLVIANTEDEPGIVRRSQPGFAGTFNKLDFIFPDSGGSEVTGIASHAGVLLAFTESSVYSLEDFGLPRPLAQGIGCVAPNSIQALPNGLLVWLGRDGFYGMSPSGQVQRLSKSIDRLMRNSLNRGRLSLATAAVDAHTNEYRCAVSKAGSPFNNLILCFDGQNWRRHELNVHIADMCRTDDFSQHLLALVLDYTAKVDSRGNVGLRETRSPVIDDTYGYVNPSVYDLDGSMSEPMTHLLVLDRETGDTVYTPPPRTVVYRSGWFRADVSGLVPVNVRSLFVGMVDAWDGDATVRIFKNGSEKPVHEITDLRLIGVDNESDVVKDLVGQAINRDSKFHSPRFFWRQVPVGLENVNTWCFEIEIEQTPSFVESDNVPRMELASFAFETSVASSGSPRGRIPLKSDR